MINAYFTNINELPGDEKLWSRLLDSVDAGFREKVLDYRDLKTRFAKLWGRQLLHKWLSTYGLDKHISIKDLEYNKWGKPGFRHSGHDFSIAHSGDIVFFAAACNGAKIGADVEKIEFREPGIMQEYFTDKEWRTIVAAADQQEYLHKFWVRKEACIKAIGKGLFLPLQEIDVTEREVPVDGKVFRLHDVYIGAGYSACIAADDTGSVVVSEVSIN